MVPRVPVSVWRLDKGDVPWLQAKLEQILEQRPDPARAKHLALERYMTLTHGLAEAVQDLKATTTSDTTPITLAAIYNGTLVGFIHGDAPNRPSLSRGLEANIRWLSAGYRTTTKPRGVGQVLVSQFYRQCQGMPVHHITLSALPWQGRCQPLDPQPSDPMSPPLNVFYWKLGMTPLRRRPDKLAEMSPPFRAKVVETWQRLGPQALDSLFVIPVRKSVKDAAAIEARFQWQPPTAPMPVPPSLPTPAPPRSS